jgi:hypothetical protein
MGKFKKVVGQEENRLKSISKKGTPSAANVGQ